MGTGRDSLTMSSGDISGGAAMGDGADTVTLSGSAEIDLLSTGTGNDNIDLSQSVKVKIIDTGDGDDTLNIASRVDVHCVSLGQGTDTVNLAHGADVALVDGGMGIDTLNVSGGKFRVDWLNDDPTSGEGYVVYLDDSGKETGERTAFHNIENVACFTLGTQIITANGARRIEDIRAGERVYTLDNGLQPVQWVGQTTVLASGDLAPVRFDTGAFGNLRPIEVSPQHRMLLADWRCDMVCGTDEVLAPALTLTNDTTIRRRTGGTVTYVHLMFAQHEIIFGDGIPSESFHPGAQTLRAMDAATRAEILRLFPELDHDLDSFGPSARSTAKRHEVALIQLMQN